MGRQKPERGASVCLQGACEIVRESKQAHTNQINHKTEPITNVDAIRLLLKYV